MEIYLKLFEVLFPVFFVVGIGYYLGKKDPNINTSFITNFRIIDRLLSIKSASSFSFTNDILNSNLIK